MLIRGIILQLGLFFLVCSPASADDWFCISFAHDSLVESANRWKTRDGSQGFAISDQFLFSLAACPETTYDFMRSRPDLLNSWLENLENLSGFAVTRAEGEAREIALSKLVKAIKSEAPTKSTADVRDRILSRIESMCVRIVDEPAPKPPCYRVSLNP